MEREAVEGVPTNLKKTQERATEYQRGLSEKQ
jgi:hypothetical protein